MRIDLEIDLDEIVDEVVSTLEEGSVITAAVAEALDNSEIVSAIESEIRDIVADEIDNRNRDEFLSEIDGLSERIERLEEALVAASEALARI